MRTTVRALFLTLVTLSIGCGLGGEDPTASSDDCPTCFDACRIDSDCDDGNPCTVDSCEPAFFGTFCQSVPTDGNECDDDNACTHDDVCHDGECRGETTVCNATSSCQGPGTCNPDTGECNHPPINEGKNCNDDDPCTLNDVCRGGTCEGKARSCGEKGGCRVNATCNPDTGECDFDLAPNGTPCDDGNACTRSDTCSGGFCLGNDEVQCEPDPAPCTTNECNPATGQCETRDEEVGTNCSQDCSKGTCEAGDCVSFAPDCTDPPMPECVNGVLTLWEPNGVCGVNGETCVFTPVSETCPTGECNIWNFGCEDPICETAPDRTECDDQNPCTFNMKCSGGSCGGGMKDCTDLNSPCMKGVCDPHSGECTAAPRPDGASCNDNDSCTVRDSCTDGICAGITPDDIEPNDERHQAVELLDVHACTERLLDRAIAQVVPGEDVDWYSYHIGDGAGQCTGATTNPRVEVRNLGYESVRLCAYFQCDNGKPLDSNAAACSASGNRAPDAPAGMQGCCQTATGDGATAAAQIVDPDCRQRTGPATGTVYVRVEALAALAGCGYELRWGEVDPAMSGN